MCDVLQMNKLNRGFIRRKDICIVMLGAEAQKLYYSFHYKLTESVYKEGKSLSTHTKVSSFDELSALTHTNISK
jgi:hypothetical protein